MTIECSLGNVKQYMKIKPLLPLPFTALTETDAVHVVSCWPEYYYASKLTQINEHIAL